MSDLTRLKILFAGTPEFAAHHLSALIESQHEVVCVYTQPDRPAGRGKKLAASAVKQVAMAAGLPIAQPTSLKDTTAQDALRQWQADLMVVVAYGLILPRAVLETPRYGCINVHASLLPRWRGAAPIQRAIEAGDSETGITIMQMDEGLDTGAMLHKTCCPIDASDTAQSLHDKLAELGPSALLTTLEQVAQGRLQPEAQDSRFATYAHKLDKNEAQIDWHLPAEAIARRVRAFNPFPVAFTLLDGERVRVLQARPAFTSISALPGSVLPGKGIAVACGEGTSLELDQLQLPGKKPMSAGEILNGFAHKWTPGKQLGLEPA